MQKTTKTVVITGASSGIGRACVTQMIRAGWRVFATVRKAEDKDRLLAEKTSNLSAVLLDVEQRETIAMAAEQVAAVVGAAGLDGLANVAGIGMVRPMEYASAHDIQQIFDINVFGQVAVTQAFLPLLRKSCGRIVNISSVGAHIAIPFAGLLNASKSAFGCMADTLRLELRPFGIHVSTVEPGAIKTPAVEKTLGAIEKVIHGLPEQGRAQYAEMLREVTRRGYEREMNGSSPDVVAQAVHHALTATRPRIRYRVGKDAKLIGALPRLLPDRILDAIRLRTLGLPTKFGAVENRSSTKAVDRVA